jgi:hypothetical protein
MNKSVVAGVGAGVGVAVGLAVGLTVGVALATGAGVTLATGVGVADAPAGWTRPAVAKRASDLGEFGYAGPVPPEQPATERATRQQRNDEKSRSHTTRIKFSRSQGCPTNICDTAR